MVQDQVKVYDPKYTKWNYFKFCKLVEHKFVDYFSKRNFLAWQYSLTSNLKDVYEPSVQFIKIDLEFSPITM